MGSFYVPIIGSMLDQTLWPSWYGGGDSNDSNSRTLLLRLWNSRVGTKYLSLEELPREVGTKVMSLEVKL